MKTKKKMTVGRAALYIIVYIAALFWIFPVIWMLVSSLKPYGTPVSILSKVLTGVFSLDNYTVVARKAPIIKWIFNSASVAIAVTIGTLMLTSLAAYAISKLKFKGRTAIFLLITAGMMVPIESIIIPLYQEMAELKLLNTYVGLMCPSLAAPIGVLIMKRCYDGIPDELIEAAVLDGANAFER